MNLEFDHRWIAIVSICAHVEFSCGCNENTFRMEQQMIELKTAHLLVIV